MSRTCLVAVALLAAGPALASDIDASATVSLTGDSAEQGEDLLRRAPRSSPSRGATGARPSGPRTGPTAHYRPGPSRSYAGAPPRSTGRATGRPGTRARQATPPSPQSQPNAQVRPGASPTPCGPAGCAPSHGSGSTSSGRPGTTPGHQTPTTTTGTTPTQPGRPGSPVVHGSAPVSYGAGGPTVSHGDSGTPRPGGTVHSSGGGTVVHGSSPRPTTTVVHGSSPRPTTTVVHGSPRPTTTVVVHHARPVRTVTYTHVAPYHGVFVYGPRPTTHVTYVEPAGGGEVQVRQKDLPERQIDREHTLAIGVMGGAMMSATPTGSFYSDPGLGVVGRYRVAEPVALELGVAHHANSFDVETTRSQTQVNGDVKLFAFPWTRVSPYALAGATYNAANLQDEIFTGDTAAVLETVDAQWGLDAGLGLELAMGNNFALDLQGKYIGWLDERYEGESPGAFQFGGGLAFHFK